MIVHKTNNEMAVVVMRHTWNDVFHWRGFYHSFLHVAVMLE